MERVRNKGSMISQTAEYALRAVVHLASLQNRNESVSQTAQQIAQSTCVPGDYLPKILKSLRRSGLVAVQHGPGGGFQLARPAACITLYDVVQAVDVVPRIHRCPLGLEAHATQLCPLHQQLDDAMAAVEEMLRATTIVMVMDGAPLFAAAGRRSGPDRIAPRRGRVRQPLPAT